MDTLVSRSTDLSKSGGAAGRRGEKESRGPDNRRDEDDLSRLLWVLGGLPASERRRSDPREAIILGYLPLVERLARRFIRRDVARDELIQAGAIGLMLAVDRFDARRGVPFVAYAVPTILGSIQQYLRDTAPIVRAPRRRDGGAPVETVAGGAGWAGGAGRPRKTGSGVVAVHVTLLGDWQDLATRPGRLPPFAYVDPAFESIAERLTVARHVRDLGPRDRKLIYLRFYEGESLAQIADRMGLSVSRVSRLLTRALATLRNGLETPEGSR